MYYKKKTNWMENVEKFKFFINIQHRNSAKNNLQKLITNGVIHDSPNYILKEKAKYLNDVFF